MLARIRSFARAFTGRARFEREMDEELAAHVEARTRDLIARGLSAEDAARLARAEFGEPIRWKEAGRDARGLRLVDDLRSDVRYGLRWLRRSRGFAAAAGLSLALGIGANAAIFSLLNAVLLRSLPVSHSDQLVLLATAEAGKDPNYAFSFRLFQAFQARARSLVGVCATARLRMNVEVDGRTLPSAAGQMVSENYYDLLGVPAAIGRTLEPGDGPAGVGATAVLSDGYWTKEFGRERGVVGKLIRINGQVFTIVGVSAPEFSGTHVGEAADITVPLSMQPLVNVDSFGSSLVSGLGAYDYWLELIGRVRSDWSVEAAEAEANGIYQQMLPEILTVAGAKAAAIGHPQLRLEPGSQGLSELRRRFSRPLLVLMASVALVLLIACANVANLLVARAAARRREVAIRISLGAGRARLVRQMLTESLLLSIGGGIVGLLLAVLSERALGALLVDGSSPALGSVLDFRLLGFTLGVSVLTGLAFGIVPAFSGSQVEAFAALKARGDQLTSAGRRRGLQRSLVAAQVAVSAVLLVGAGLFIRTLANLRHRDLGFEQAHVLAVRLEPRGSNQKHQNGLRLMQQYGELVARLQGIPGVRAVSLSGSTPLAGENRLAIAVVMPGYSPRTDEDMHVRLMQIYPGYLAVMGIPLLAGRDLSDAENDARLLNDPEVIHATVINATMARRFFDSATAAIGHRFSLSGNGQVCEIVGVAADVRDRGIRDDVTPLAYATYAQTPTGRGQMTLLVRAVGDPLSLIGTIRRLARTIDPTMPLLDAETLADRVGAATNQERLVALLSSVFGALALVLAIVGLYGVMAYTVARRRSEFGLRMVLGASPGGLLALVLGESLALVGVGLLVGLVVAGVVARTLSSLLFGLEPLDPAVFVGAAVVMLVVSTLAAYVPARQVTRVDPLVALRVE